MKRTILLKFKNLAKYRSKNSARHRSENNFVELYVERSSIWAMLQKRFDYSSNQSYIFILIII